MALGNVCNALTRAWTSAKPSPCGPFRRLATIQFPFRSSRIGRLRLVTNSLRQRYHLPFVVSMALRLDAGSERQLHKEAATFPLF